MPEMARNGCNQPFLTFLAVPSRNAFQTRVASAKMAKSAKIEHKCSILPLFDHFTSGRQNAYSPKEVLPRNDRNARNVHFWHFLAFLAIMARNAL